MALLVGKCCWCTTVWAEIGYYVTYYFKGIYFISLLDFSRLFFTNELSSTFAFKCHKIQLFEMSGL